ncbi:hypothetical protein N7468_003523 [Penicillium chermesinum]|uniref:Uncharacterized protein n=1 Tax=Penicillium chermesinum TaxID=63820 RepID=A0A9W9P6V2_9EURO|nr:uncharacterized protein N7468_003523 [Penicillium chermesinum]KAJ5238904.1 hypothetical protein N7468_003523 [Penicillium chermesinum]KAJ6164542.1 hypothetical protein N7470_003214 [Penicillium chermesinum]
MGTPGQYALYVFCIILGSVLSVVIGYAIHSMATNGFSDGPAEKELGEEQRAYMREVRERNLEALIYECRRKG